MQFQHDIDGRNPAQMSLRDFVQVWARVGAEMVDWNGGPLTNDFVSFGSAWRELLLSNPANRGLFESEKHLTEEIHSMFTLGLWASYGFPMYRLSEDLATGLLMTKPARPTADQPLWLPFPSFMVQLPPKTVPIFVQGEQVWADHLWFERCRSISSRDGQEHDFLRWTAGYKTVRVWRDRYVDDLSGDCGFKDENFYTLPSEDLQHVAEDEITLDHTLTVGLNLVGWLESVGGAKASQKKRYTDAQKKRARKGKVILPTLWILGKEIKLPRELKEHREDFALGRSRHAPKGWRQRIKRVVPGHWQHYWVGSGDQKKRIRKLKEPYWVNKDSAVAYGHLYTDDDTED